MPLGVLNRLGGIRTQSRTTYSVPHFSISASALPSRCGSHNVPPNCRPPSCHVPILELRGSIPSSEVWGVIPLPTRRPASFKPGRPKMGDRSPFFHRVPNNIICHFLGRVKLLHRIRRHICFIVYLLHQCGASHLQLIVLYYFS